MFITSMGSEVIIARKILSFGSEPSLPACGLPTTIALGVDVRNTVLDASGIVQL